MVSLGGRWKFWIWYHLFSGPKRFGELQQLLPQANRQTLTVQLRELEQMGVLGICADAPKGRIRVDGIGTTVRIDASPDVCLGEVVLRADRPGV